VRVNGRVYGFRMTRTGDTAQVLRWLEAGTAAARGPVIILPMTPAQRQAARAEEDRLAAAQQEARRAALMPEDLGVFEKVIDEF